MKDMLSWDDYHKEEAAPASAATANIANAAPAMMEQTVERNKTHSNIQTKSGAGKYHYARLSCGG